MNPLLLLAGSPDSYYWAASASTDPDLMGLSITRPRQMMESAPPACVPCDIMQPLVSAEVSSSVVAVAAVQKF